MTHRNAPLSVEGRERLVRRCQTRPIAHVAVEMGISRACASKWVNRHRQFGDLGLVDVLGEQFGGMQAAFLERLPVPAFGGWFAAGRHRLVLLPRHLHVTLHRKDL